MNPAPNLHSSKEALTAPAPLVSVIIPAYNAERFILEALESIDTQRYLPLEILLIDDGSTDGTVELVRRHAPNVQIVSQPNAGASAARNTGLRVSRVACPTVGCIWRFPGTAIRSAAETKLHD